MQVFQKLGFSIRIAMKISFKIFSTLFILLVVSCSKETAELYKSDSNSVISTRSEYLDQDNFLSISEAITIVKSSGKNREIKSIKLNNSRRELSSSFYEITFISGNKEGYAVVSSDSRIKEPICVVENGSLSDTTSIIPLKYYFRAIPDYIISQRQELDSLSKESKITSIATRSIPDLNPDNSTLIDTYYTFSRDTLLKTVPVEWGQCPPLGTNIDDDRGYCSVPAVAHVMAYHKKSYSGYTLSDWNNMIAGLNDTAVADIGLRIYNGLYWLNNWIAPLPSHVVTFLEDNNYSASSSSGYSYTSFYQKLQYGPVIFLGFYRDPVTHPNTGHYWVADGAISHGMTTVYVYQHNDTGIIFEMQGNTVYNRWIRYNWGWAGSSNGWFNSGVFQPSSSSHNYSHSIRLIKVQP